MEIWILTFVLILPGGTAEVEGYFKEKEDCEAKLSQVMSRYDNEKLLSATCTLSISL